MILIDCGGHPNALRITAQGNFSLDASGLLLLLLALGVVTLGLAGVLAWQGYWPVLLFALLQLVLVGWILVRAWKNTWMQEEICIDAQQIRIVQKRYGGRREVCFETAWARLCMEYSNISWYPARLVLRSRLESLELGAFLTHAEKSRLASRLQTALSPLSAWQTPATFTRSIER